MSSWALSEEISSFAIHLSIASATTRQNPTEAKNKKRSPIAAPIRKGRLENKNNVDRKNSMPNAHGSLRYFMSRYTPYAPIDKYMAMVSNTHILPKLTNGMLL